MSHSHLGAPREEQESDKRIWPGHIIVGIFVLALVAGAVAVRMSPLNFSALHETTYGTLLETRIDVVNSGASIYGGYIRYQIMARVSYSYGNATEVRWMPASESSRSREWLQARLNQHPALCLVYWPAGHLDNPRCRIQWPSGQ